MADYTIVTNIVDGTTATGSGSGGLTITASVESGTVVTANLSTTGVRGLQGPQGETGLQGPRGDVGPQGPPGLDGNMAGPVSSTDNAIARYNGTTGTTLQDSGVTVSDTDGLTVPGLLTTQQELFIDNAAPSISVWNAADRTLGIVNYGGGKANLSVQNDLSVGGSLTARLAPRVSSAASAASITPDISANDQYHLSAQAEALTINAPTGSPVNGDRLLLRIKDNGTARAITWNAIYRAIGMTLPVLTIASKMMYVGCVYNSADTKWDVIAVSMEA